jgi:hypothetical protein
MELAHSQVESASRPQVALLASCIVARGYRGVISDGANAAIKALEGNGSGRLVSGLSLDLRNAKAHRSYKLSSDQLTVELLKSNGNLDRRLSGPELADTIIAGQVTTLSLLVGCYLGAVALDVDPLNLFSNLIGFPFEISAQVAYTMAGWGDTEVEIVDDGTTLEVRNCPSISATLPGTPEFDNFIIATSIIAVLPPSVVELRFYDDEEEPLELSTDTAWKMRDTSVSDDLEKVATLCLVRRGDRSVMDRDALRVLLTRLGSRAIELEPIAAIKRLQEIRRFAIDKDDVEFASLIKNAMGSVRSKIL